MRVWMLLGLLACDQGIQSGKFKPGEGDACEGECLDGLTCGHDGLCQTTGEPGTAVDGADCSASADCAWGLECSSDNVCVDEAAGGTGGDGATCDDDDDCQAGFACDDGACVDLEVPYWAGGACPADAADADEFRVLFQVPDLPTTDELDFFSMPFPNDLRLDAEGHRVLDGFPDPGEAAPGVGRLLSFLEQETYWGLDPVVYFRFNKPHDLDSIRVLTTDATVHFADITDPDEDGDLSAFQYFTRQSRDRYICQNWLAITTFPGEPLLPNRTYAVWVTKGVTSGGDEIFRDDDFPMLMQDDRPDDLTDARAFDTFGPFREYVDAQGLTRGDIVAATVFTTGDPARDLRYAREVVEAETTEVSVAEVGSCGASPCGRACVGASGLAEHHALVNVPDFAGDGVVQYNSTFRPEVRATASVCAVYTIPDGEAPEAGWPVAVWIGDLGGDAQDAVQNGVAEALAAEGVATLSIDLPHHGDRTTGDDPLADWFAVEFPGAWRATLFQTFADGLSLHRLAADAQLGLDPDEVWLVAEGVGADAGVPLLAWGRDYRGGALGNPAGLLGELATRRGAPYDLEHALQRAYADTNLNRYQPAVSLLQMWLGPLDPMSSGQGVLRDADTLAKHVLVVSGVDDAEVHDDARHAVLRTLSVPTVGELLEDFDQGDGGDQVYENVSTDDGRRTAAELQFEAGHHALSEVGVEAVTTFVQSGVEAGSPTIRD